MLRAAEVLRLVSGALQDLEPGMESRWPWEGGEDDKIGLIDFLNDALREVAIYRPDAYAVTESIRLEPGMRQKLPCKRIHHSRQEATTLIELVRNMGCDGETPGRAISAVDMGVLLAWADMPKTAPVVDNFAYDRLTNKGLYYVYPAVPVDRDVWVEATYSAMPSQVASPEQHLGVPGEYATAIKHHMLASVMSGDNESSNAAKASYHIQMFSSLLGVKAQIDTSWPKAKSSNPVGG